VAGANRGKILALPAGWRAIAGIVPADPDAPEAKRNSRYPITEFGIKMGTVRTHASWKAAQKRGDLRVRYKGVTKPAELNELPCWELARTEELGADKEGIVRSRFYFDRATGLQVGTVLLDADDGLIGSYYFRDLKLNPEFSADTFTREGLRKK
jgi:hypothetical protein